MVNISLSFVFSSEHNREFSSGNLALSRALGDFIFKRNIDKRPEEQVVTGEIECE